MASRESPQSTAQSFAQRAQSVAQRQGVRQFVKFCIVGASSTAISFGISSWLIYFVHLDRLLHVWLTGRPPAPDVANPYLPLAVQLAALIGFLFAVTNGFVWNSRWTFRQNDPELRKVRYAKFVLVNAVGLVLNQTIVFVVYGMLVRGRPTTEKGLEPLIAMAVATVIVVFWNFLANKYWTFKS